MEKKEIKKLLRKGIYHKEKIITINSSPTTVKSSLCYLGGSVLKLMT